VNRLKELRASKHMKQSELGKLLNVSPSAISNYETEFREIDAPTIRKLCEIFGCTSDYLLGISGAPVSSISNEDALVLDAYHAAPDEIRGIIDHALAPYRKDAGASIPSTA